MTNTQQINSSPRGLEIEPLKITQYKVIAINIANDLDQQFRRTAIATVVEKNKYDCWDGNSMHHIELKHCYNKASKGPNKTPYNELITQIIDIIEIQSASYGDLDIVKWQLLECDIRM